MNCYGCGCELTAANTYASTKKLYKTCKSCWNRRCKAYRRGNAAYHANQARNKARWDALNPERKRIIEGRATFLGRANAPAKLVELERLIMQL